MDFLDEDTKVNRQTYAIISYTLPKKADLKGKTLEGGSFPMLKIRGSYGSVEECEQRIKRLQRDDKYFNMYIIEVGKWGALLDEDQLKQQNIDAKYQEETMNQIIQGYKENKDKNDIEFEKRKEWMKQKATEDGTKEGQAILAGQKEHYLSVKQRLETSTQHLSDLHEQLAEIQKIYDDSRAKIQEYTPEEIEQAEMELNKLQIREVEE